MKNWIVQTDVHDKECSERLINSIKNFGVKVLEIDKNWNYLSLPIQFSDAIFYGSLEFGEILKNPRGYINLFIDNISDFDCHNYYPRIKNLLNKDFFLIPKGCILDNEELIKDSFVGDKLFIRPNSSDKSFTGTTISKKWFKTELSIIFEVSNFTARRIVQDHELILFSSYKNVENEVRLVIVDGEVVASSTYLGDKTIETNIDISGCLPFCTIDVCVDTLKIIEMNSFSFASFYNCDTDKIVSYINNYFEKRK